MATPLAVATSARRQVRALVARLLEGSAVAGCKRPHRLVGAARATPRSAAGLSRNGHTGDPAATATALPDRRPAPRRSLCLQARCAVVRVCALAQKAEYIWHDGQEGQPIKVRQCAGPAGAGDRTARRPAGQPAAGACAAALSRPPPSLPCAPCVVPQGAVFNEMRSKTKVLQKPITTFNPKDFPGEG